ncbi:hypothetical protein GOV05_02930 [Candidatus Woesearchaeota archaeon]|nr:hypothetical protein [Candidatus Woesearchaeota archaeon]
MSKEELKETQELIYDTEISLYDSSKNKLSTKPKKRAEVLDAATHYLEEDSKAELRQEAYFLYNLIHISNLIENDMPGFINTHFKKIYQVASTGLEALKNVKKPRLGFIEDKVQDASQLFLKALADSSKSIYQNNKLFKHAKKWSENTNEYVDSLTEKKELSPENYKDIISYAYQAKEAFEELFAHTDEADYLVTAYHILDKVETNIGGQIGGCEKLVKLNLTKRDFALSLDNIIEGYAHLELPALNDALEHITPSLQDVEESLLIQRYHLLRD